MKKLVLILLMTVAGNAVAACTSAEKVRDEKRDVASEEQKAEQWKSHQKYLDKVDKIR